MCERVVTDIDNHILNPDVKHLMDNADGNVFYQLQDKYNKLIMKLKDCNNKAELSRVTIETMFDEVTSKELSTQEIYLSKVNNLVKSSVKQKLDEIMGNLSVDNATSCLHDEILHHILECQRKCDVFVGHNEVLQTMKAYIQGRFQRYSIMFQGWISDRENNGLTFVPKRGYFLLICLNFLSCFFSKCWLFQTRNPPLSLFLAVFDVAFSQFCL